MSAEIAFPLEFVVQGVPVSQQAKRSKSRNEWKERVREASYTALPESHRWALGPITVTLLYFPDRSMQGDVDNIVKPILDALRQHVYADDRQVERVLVQKFEPAASFQFSNPSDILSGALSAQKPILYVRIGDDPSEGIV